jgi:hypothetical protein
MVKWPVSSSFPLSQCWFGYIEDSLLFEGLGLPSKEKKGALSNYQAQRLGLRRDPCLVSGYQRSKINSYCRKGE